MADHVLSQEEHQTAVAQLVRGPWQISRAGAETEAMLARNVLPGGAGTYPHDDVTDRHVVLEHLTRTVRIEKL